MRKYILSIGIILIAFSLFANTNSRKIKVNPGENLIGADPGKQVTGILRTASPIDNKIDPLLKYLIRDAESSARNADMLLEKYNSANLIQLEKTPVNGIVLSVFIKSANVIQTREMIVGAGGFVTSQIGDIIIARLPLSEVESVAERDEVKYIETNVYSKPKLNVSSVAIEADKVHAGTGLSQSYKGQGVVVGVVDSGIDWEHEDFDDANGTRIQYLWDMSGNVNPPSGYNYGTEYTKAQIDASQCNEIDGDDGGGHGTHVSATAAGQDNAVAGYTGIAPESDIIFVKGFRNGPGFADTDVVNGCDYIFSKAQSMGKSCVINLSLGGHYGAHDGTSLYEQSLSNLTGPGKVVVAAAGNEGSDLIHLSYQTSGSSINEAHQTYWLIPQGSNFSGVDMWYTPGNISVGIAAYDTQLNLLGYSNPVSPGQSIEDLPFDIGGGQVLGLISIDATTMNDPNNNDNRITFSIDGNNGQYDLSAVYWSIYTFGSGSFDAWMITGGYFTTDDDPVNLIHPGDNDKSIGIPGTSGKVICVGSYVSKNQWIDIDGNLQTQPGSPTIGDISSFSSRGPSRDNRMKPDITAPGEVIIAALSGDVTVGGNGTPRSNILQGGKLQKLQGTSMASPHVTGTVALMLQKNPDLDYDGVFSILTNNTDTDNFTGSSPGNTFGHGKLNAYKAVQATEGGGNPNPILVMLEGFDTPTFPPPGWTSQVLNQANTWYSGNPANNNFNQINPSSVNSAICPWVDQNQDEWLITSSFSLGDGTSDLKFYAGYSTNWLTNATLKLHISTDGGSTWTQLWEAENDGQDWIWREKTVDLSAYANMQNLSLGWQYVGNDGDLVGLDDIQILNTPLTAIEDKNDMQISQFVLHQNFPNPFNPVTTISFELPNAGDVKLTVFNLLGEEVEKLVSGHMPAGQNEIAWDAGSFPTGVYFYKLEAGKFIETRKMILLK